MNEVLQELAGTIKKTSKIAFLGVGSPLRSDDNTGNRIVAVLEDKLKADPGQEYHFYQGESAPENFTGVIRAFSPEYLVVFDAAELGKPPGSFALIAPDKIDGIGFASHVLPLKIICNYLSSAVGRRVFLIGVQPQSLEFGENLSPAVEEAINEFITGLLDLLGRSL
jgi:hydrogenase 3 maturation protease